MPKEIWYKKLSNILGVIVVIGSLITALFTLDNRYAKCQNVEQLKIDTSKTLQQVRIDIKQDRLNDRYDRLKDRKRDLEYQVRKYPKDQDLKNDLEEVKEELAVIKQQIINLEKLQQ